MGAIDSYSGPPTARQVADVDVLSAELEPALAVVKKLTDEDLPRLNKLMADAGVPYVALVASAKRAAAVRSELELADELRAQLRTPAGLRIGAQFNVYSCSTLRGSPTVPAPS